MPGKSVRQMGKSERSDARVSTPRSLLTLLTLLTLAPIFCTHTDPP
jgi:hypothetical protein